MFQYSQEYNVRSFENFDKNKCGDRSSNDVAQALEDLHHGRDTTMTRSFGVSPSNGGGPCVVKWRPYVNGATRRLNEVLYENYIPVFLARKSLIVNCSKIIANEMVYGTRWPQFGNWTEKKEDPIVDQSFMRKVQMEMEDLLPWIREMLHTLEKSYGRKVPVAFSEDIFNPYIDVNQFVNTFSKLTGEDIHLNLPNGFNPETSPLSIENFYGFSSVKKVGVDVKNLKGFDLLLKDSQINRLDEDYLKVLNGTDE